MKEDRSTATLQVMCNGHSIIKKSPGLKKTFFDLRFFDNLAASETLNIHITDPNGDTEIDLIAISIDYNDVRYLHDFIKRWMEEVESHYEI